MVYRALWEDINTLNHEQINIYTDVVKIIILETWISNSFDAEVSNVSSLLGMIHVISFHSTGRRCITIHTVSVARTNSVQSWILFYNKFFQKLDMVSYPGPSSPASATFCALSTWNGASKNYKFFWQKCANRGRLFRYDTLISFADSITT